MKNFNLLASTAIAASLLFAAPALAEDIATPGNTQGWTAQNVRTDASVGITGTYAPAGETGPLQFSTNTVTSGQDKADYVHALSGTLGDLVTNPGAALSYDYFVDSSSTTNNGLAPAFRLGFEDTASGHSGYLIWEAVYNGGTPVATDSWVSNDILDGNFWMRTFSPGATVQHFDVSLADWANGTTFTSPEQSWTLSSNTLITSVEVGVGSGWGNSFSGAVDHVNVDFGNGIGGVSTNFELTGGAVPEPATWAMMLVGFGGLGAVMRKRRAMGKTAFA